MFAQVDPSLERGHGGLGVGLALARSLVELHGGTIEARSKGLGKGSDFIVRLPILPSARQAPLARESEPAAAPTLIGRRILVADDNVDSARTFASVLRLSGHDVEMAHDGLDALAAAQTFVPDVVFLDIGMPRMNGYDVAQKLRARFGKRLVLVAITGWGKEEDKRRALDAGFDHHLTKPVDVESVEALLSRARPG